MRDTSKHLWISMILALFMTAIALLSTTQVARADGPIYVDRDAPGPTHDGLSWATAYINVQDGLDAATPGDEIWVAEGVYVPTNVSGREATFQLVSGIQLYGGFGGYGTGETERSQRDWEAHVTVLSGDLDGNDATDPNGVVIDTANISGNNAYHVVTGSGADDTAVLDGFAVTGGKADGAAVHYGGGGIYNSYYGNPTLTNVTFSGNYADEGGGMYNFLSDPTLSNVTFSSNYADEGGGMYNWDSDPTLTNVTFSGNRAYSRGGGMYNFGEPTLINVTFSGNHANDSGGGMYSEGNPTLINVAFSGNQVSYINSYGGGMSNGGNPTLINVTFSGNQASGDDSSGGGMSNGYSSNPTLSNCILWGNTARHGPQIHGGAPTINYSLVEGGYSGTGNLDVDPLFVDADGPDDIAGTYDDNLRLLPASPAVDAGDNTVVPGDTLDLDGDGITTEPLPFDMDNTPRFVDVPFRPDTGNGTPPIVDMGAYETTPDLQIAKAVLPATSRAPGDPITFTLTFANYAATVATGVVITDVVPAEVTGLGVISSGVAITRIPGVTYAWTVQDLAPGAGGVITITGVISPDLTAVFDFVNTSVITTTAVDTDTTNNRSSVQIHVSGIIYVDADAPGVADGSSWTNAYTNLQDALTLATPGDEIWVAEGVYVPTNTSGQEATFQLVSGIQLYGGFGGYGTGETQRGQRDWEAHVTVLSGDLDGNDITDPNGVVIDTDNIDGNNAYHVVTSSGTDDTAVLDGFAVTGGRTNDGGGGMRNGWDSSPTLTNVTFSGNHAEYNGGGMFNVGNPTLTNVTFSGNHAEHNGGGMADSGDSTLTNVTFSGNTADWSGGGMSNAGNSMLVNVTFSGNQANSGGGGMHNEYGNPTLINVTFIGNRASWGGGMSNGSNPTLTNVTFSGNHAEYNGGGMSNGGNPTLTNVTFSGNTAAEDGGGMSNDTNSMLSNCILWGNTASSNPQIRGPATINYSLVEGGYSGTGNLDADPLFVDADGPDDVAGTLDDNLRLLPVSPAVDAGDNTAVPTDTLDLDGDGVFTEPLPFDMDGNPRFVDVLSRPDTGSGLPPIVDVGAYEANPGDLWITKAAIPATPRDPGDPITYTLTFANDATGVATDVIITDVVPAEVTGLGIISSGVVITRISGVTYAWAVQDLASGMGGLITITGAISPGLTGPLDFINTAVITTTAVDTDTTNNRSSVQIHVSGIIYVDADAPGTDTGLSWTDAFTNLQDALALAEPGSEMWVAEGVYVPTNVSGREATFQLVNGVSLYGGFGGYGTGETQRSQRDWEAHVTVLSGDLDGNDVTDSNGVVIDTDNIYGNNAYHVVTGSGTDDTAVLDGFTVTGGKADGSHPHNYGGGMHNSYGNPTLTSVTFSGNTAAAGGGTYNRYSDPTLTNVAFSGNTAAAGGGMYNEYSNPTLTNVTFGANHANLTGGGMYNEEGNPTLTNVTFSGNRANGSDSFGGGMYNRSGNPTLINVTFTGNQASGINTGGGGMYNAGNSMLINVTFSGNQANGSGGGMVNEYRNPTLINVTFSSNQANGSGGGMYNRDDPMLINITFSGNHAVTDGGGMYNAGNPMLINVTFSGNQANSSGGGMYNDWGNPMLTNVTFSSNHAGYEGGGMYNYYVEGGPTLTNCILWGNTASSNLQIGGSATVNYSLVEGGYSGTGNLDADPLFVDFDGTDNITGTLDDNLRLLPTSPAVDAGDNTAVPTDTFDLDGDGVFTEPLPFDLDGNPRFADMPSRPDTGNGTPPIVDMGAYETVPILDLTVTKWASPDPVQAGAQLTYTIRVANTGDVDLHATITDTLPLSVTLGGTSGGTLIPPGGTVALPDGTVGITWTAFITAPDGVWTGTIVVTVDEGHDGPLTNRVEVTTEEGAAGDAVYIVNARKVYLPLVLRESKGW
jgi:uncharacterized repeat protein (TIGR01451 family)